VAKTPSDLTPISYRPKDAARVLGFGHSHFSKLLKAGKIRHRKDGVAVLIDREELIAYRNSLPVAAPDQIPIGPLLPVDEQKIALERARSAGKPIPPPVPPPLPRPPDIDLAAIYEGRLKLLIPNVGPDEAHFRASEFTVRACARHFGLGLDEAKEKTLVALAKWRGREPNPSPKRLFASAEPSGGAAA
jgi:excisionase family DNA binding protein